MADTCYSWDNQSLSVRFNQLNDNYRLAAAATYQEVSQVSQHEDQGQHVRDRSGLVFRRCRVSECRRASTPIPVASRRRRRWTRRRQIVRFVVVIVVAEQRNSLVILDD